MKYRDILDKLRLISPDEYEIEAKILVEHFTKNRISYYYLNKDEEIDNSELTEALRKREKHIPLQYIIGKWDFYRQTYFVDENCLIPRSDTEILVEKAIELLPQNASFIDLCTGSGCIAISILAERSDTDAVMVDKFSKTLDIACKNSALNGVRERVTPMLFDVLSDEKQLQGMEFDAIISNPPYIRPDVIETLSEEVKCEPYEALYGGDDGLIFYNKIIKDYSEFLKKDGFMLFEIGYDQAEEIRQIASDNAFECRIFKDLGGNDRVALLNKK